MTQIVASSTGRTSGPPVHTLEKHRLGRLGQHREAALPALSMPPVPPLQWADPASWTRLRYAEGVAEITLSARQVHLGCLDERCVQRPERLRVVVRLGKVDRDRSYCLDSSGCLAKPRTDQMCIWGRQDPGASSTTTGQSSGAEFGRSNMRKHQQWGWQQGSYLSSKA